MKRSQNSIIHHYKLPPKLIELLKVAETTSLVGFGATQKQQDFMLLIAILSTKTPDFHYSFNKELNDYFATLSDNLSVNLSD